MLSGLRILLAEDNPINQMVASQMLQVLGAEVVLAADGVEALERLAEGPFDLLLLDIEMPRMTGIELMRHVRAPGSAHRDTPCIALTAYVMREHLAAIDAAGAEGVIAKPVMSVEQFGEDILRIMTEAGRGTTPDTDAGAVDPAVLDGLAASLGTAAVREVTERALADVDAAGSRLTAALATDDRDEIRATTHMLISLAGAIGAGRLETAAREINEAAHAEGAMPPSAEPGAVAREIEAVLDFLRRRLASG